MRRIATALLVLFHLIIFFAVPAHAQRGERRATMFGDMATETRKYLSDEYRQAQMTDGYERAYCVTNLDLSSKGKYTNGNDTLAFIWSVAPANMETPGKFGIAKVSCPDGTKGIVHLHVACAISDITCNQVEAYKYGHCEPSPNDMDEGVAMGYVVGAIQCGPRELGFYFPMEYGPKPMRAYTGQLIRWAGSVALATWLVTSFLRAGHR